MPQNQMDSPKLYYYDIRFKAPHTVIYSCLVALKDPNLTAKDIEDARELAYPDGYIPYIGAIYYGYLTSDECKELVND